MYLGCKFTPANPAHKSHVVVNRDFVLRQGGGMTKFLVANKAGERQVILVDQLVFEECSLEIKH